MKLIDLLNLDRPMYFFDLETTGRNPREDRIVEIGFVQLTPGKPERQWSTLVNPTILIPSEATFGKPGTDFEGHGITDEMVGGCRRCDRSRAAHLQPPVGTIGEPTQDCRGFGPWPTFADLAPSLLRGFTNCDFGGYNCKTYDLPLLQAEFQRAGHQWSYTDAHILDGFRLWQLAKKRTLTDAAATFLGPNRAPMEAHRVLADARTSLEVVTAQLATFPQLPRNLAQLHELQWPVDPNSLDPDNKIVWVNGEAIMNFGKKWKGMRLDLMPRKDLDWIMGPTTNFSPEVKRICRDAYDGKFPERKKA